MGNKPNGQEVQNGNQLQKKETNEQSNKQTNQQKSKQNGKNDRQGKLETLNENETTNLGFQMNKKLTVEDFKFLKVVGRGSFGKVMMVKGLC